jgi:protein CLEC16A
MAYYISFLKTLSLKLNSHSIHFFFNEVPTHFCSLWLLLKFIKFISVLSVRPISRYMLRQSSFSIIQNVSVSFFFFSFSSHFKNQTKLNHFALAMVRIAVRTLTLNVFRMPLQSMQKFVKEKTAAHYFSNLVWTLRNHVLDLDISVKNTIE